MTWSVWTIIRFLSLVCLKPVKQSRFLIPKGIISLILKTLNFVNTFIVLSRIKKNCPKIEPCGIPDIISSNYFRTYQILFSPNSYEDNPTLILKLKRQYIGITFWSQKIVANLIKCLGHISEDSPIGLFLIYLLSMFLSIVEDNNKWQSLFGNNIEILIIMIPNRFESCLEFCLQYF